MKLRRKAGVWACVAVFGLGVVAAAPLVADPEFTVVIRIKKNNAGDREIEVKNRGVGLCKSAAKCPSEITWEWKRKDELAGQKIVIEFSGGTKDAEQCFGQKRYELSQPNTAITAAVSNTCPGGKSAWFYDVKCEQGGQPCPGIAAVDPGVIIDG